MSIIDPQLGFFEKYFFHKKINKILDSAPACSHFVLEGLHLSRMSEQQFVLQRIGAIYSGYEFLRHRHTYELTLAYYFGLLYTNTTFSAAATLVMQRHNYDMTGMPDSELFAIMTEHRAEIAEQTKIFLRKEGFIDYATSKAMLDLLKAYFERARSKLKAKKKFISTGPLDSDASVAMLYAARQDVFSIIVDDHTHVLGQALLAALANYWRESVGL